MTLCGAFTQGRDLSSFSEEVRDSTKKYITDCLKAAERMGAGLFVGPVYAGGKKRHLLCEGEAAREWDLAVAGLRELSGAARDCGVTIALEPLHRYSTSVVNTVDQALRMVSDIGSPAVRILFDTFHAAIEEDNVCGALEKVCAAGQLAHFHACENHRGAPGTGSQPWERLAAVLKRHGYGGCLTMELFQTGFMDAPWQRDPLSPDERARLGLNRLRSLMES